MPPLLAFLPAVIPPPSDEGPTIHDAWALTAFVLIMGSVCWYYWRRQAGRARQFESFAKESGWDFHKEGDDVMAEPFGRLPLFYKSHQLKIKPVVISRQSTRRLLMGDFAFISAARFYYVVFLGARWFQTIALARSSNRQLPLFVVAPAKRSIVEPYSGQNFMRMRFKDRPEAEVFRQNAVLLTRKPELVRELFAGERLADFIETIVEPLLESRLVLEAGGSWILVYESNGLAKPAEFPWLAEFAEKTADYFQPELAETNRE